MFNYELGFLGGWDVGSAMKYHTMDNIQRKYFMRLAYLNPKYLSPKYLIPKHHNF